MNSFLPPTLQTKLDNLHTAVVHKYKTVAEVCTALSTGKFPDVSEEEMLLTARSTDTSLPSIASTSSSKSFRPSCKKRKSGQDNMFFIRPMEQKTYIADYEMELPQFLKATQLLEQQQWLKAAQQYAIALKIIPKLGHKKARNTCLEKRAFCFSCLQAEEKAKEEQAKTIELNYVNNNPMIVGKLRARWLILPPPPPPYRPIFTPEKLKELQVAHQRIVGRENNKPALMWDHKESVLRTVANVSGLLLQHAPLWMKNDKDVVLAAVTNNGIAFKYASNYMRNNKEIALAACKNNGWALQFYNFRGDRDVVIEACTQNGLAIVFADHSFMADEELLQLGSQKRKGDEEEDSDEEEHPGK